MAGFATAGPLSKPPLLSNLKLKPHSLSTSPPLFSLSSFESNLFGLRLCIATFKFKFHSSLSLSLLLLLIHLLLYLLVLARNDPTMMNLSICLLLGQIKSG